MSHGQAHDVKAHIRIYMMVFGALMFGTVLTVLVSYIHLPAHLAIALGLAIATTKAALVATFFMHLKWERPLIYGLLILTVLSLVLLFVIPISDMHLTNPRQIHQDTAASDASQHAESHAEHH